MRRVTGDRKFSFTDNRLEGWEPDPDREVFLYDADKPNLVLRISPTGSKVFYFHRTDRRTRKTAKVKIGPLSEWTVKLARDRVDILNGETSGSGGAVPKAERPSAITLGMAFRAYMDERFSKKFRSVDQNESLYRLYIAPHAHVLMDELTYEVVNAIHQGVARGRGIDDRRVKLRRSGGKYAANRVLTVLSAVCTYHLKKHKLTGKRGNPCRDVERFDEAPRRQCLRGDEVQRFIDAIDIFKREHCVYRHTRPGRGWVKGAPIENRIALAEVLLVALVTGQRRGAVAKMKWRDLHLGNEPTWTIPPEDDKTKDTKIVTLHHRIVALLKDRRSRIDGEFVFPGARGAKRVVDPRKVFRKILEIAGITNPRLVPHSLRATFVTTGINSGKNQTAISKAVGHANIRTTEHYAALAGADCRKVADDIGDLMFNVRKPGGEAA